MADITIKLVGVETLKQNLETAFKKNEAHLSALIDAMCEKGERYAIGYLGHFDTGNTQSSILSYRKGKKGFIIAGGAAIWIEFGTGVALNGSNQHPEVVDSSIPIYPHGGYGQGKGKNINGWWYYDKNGKRCHTKGIRGNQFLFRTYKQLVEQLPELAKEVFNE